MPLNAFISARRSRHRELGKDLQHQRHVGLPVEAIGVVWIVDRILDMCRTSVNVFSDTVGAVVIARSEGEQPYETSNVERRTSEIKR